KTVPLEIRAIGSVEAESGVSVKAQVGGELMRVHIKEGQDVHKGDLLFTIDPRSLQASLAQAEATLAKDQVQIQQARAVLERDRSRIAQAEAALARDQAQQRNAVVMERRYADLLKRELIAQEQYDQFQTTAEALTATVSADAADVKSAQDAVMADEAAVEVAGETVRADQAVIDNARVQLSYATMRPPADGRTPRLLAHANEADAIVVPSQAVQAGQQNSSYVFVVKPDATVENRRIVIARTQGNDTIVTSGLEAGEKVVTDGQARLVAGAKVEVRGPGGGGERPARSERSP